MTQRKKSRLFRRAVVKRRRSGRGHLVVDTECSNTVRRLVKYIVIYARQRP